jgi:prolyl 4-hydroxylase
MNYIKYYDDVLTKEFCDSTITKFEQDTINQVKIDTDIISFTELDISQNENWNEVEKVLLDHMRFYFNKYKTDCQIDDWVWPKITAYERLRLKRYLPNDKDEFKFHADCYDLNSSRRFLVYFFYLNDVDKGGETVFQYNRDQPFYESVKPKVGRLLMFPPTWTYPHAALKPLSSNKYIIGGYLHYV